MIFFSTVEIRKYTPPFTRPKPRLLKGGVYDRYEMDIFEEAKTPLQNVFFWGVLPLFFQNFARGAQTFPQSGIFTQILTKKCSFL